MTDHRIPDATADDQILVDFILLKFDELVSLVDDMNDESANTVLAVKGSNSVAQLVIHCCGLLRRWSSTVNLGIEVPRDREAEFTAQMPVEELLHMAAQTRENFLADVAVTDHAAAPAALPEGRHHFWTASCRGVLMHIFEEISQHLGHAEITRDLVIQRQA